jgi:hypothetical protein
LKTNESVNKGAMTVIATDGTSRHDQISDTVKQTQRNAPPQETFQIHQVEETKTDYWMASL